MGAHSRPARAGGTPPDGQHFIRSRVVADELVQHAHVLEHDLIFEIGAGTGVLTEPLARSAGRVVAVELDPALVNDLRRRFAERNHVRILAGNVLSVPMPTEPFRVFGNLPFGLTTAILRRLLDDPTARLERADVIIQYEAARKRSSVYPSTLLSMGWLPWWDVTLARRIPRTGFEPAPRVDAGLLVIERRRLPLLDAKERPRFVSMLKRAFSHGSWPIRRSLRDDLAPMTWKRLARERGLRVEDRPSELDLWDWVSVFRAVDESRRT